MTDSKGQTDDETLELIEKEYGTSLSIHFQTGNVVGGYSVDNGKLLITTYSGEYPQSMALNKSETLRLIDFLTSRIPLFDKYP